MNWNGKTYFGGVGIDLFDVVGAEVQVETTGIGAQISVGKSSISANINLTGTTSLTFGNDTDLGDGVTKTDGLTVSINTGLLVAVVMWTYKLITTGDVSPIPGLAPG